MMVAARGRNFFVYFVVMVIGIYGEIFSFIIASAFYELYYMYLNRLAQCNWR